MIRGLSSGAAGWPWIGGLVVTGAVVAWRLVRDVVASRRRRAAQALQGRLRTGEIGALEYDPRGRTVGNPPRPDHRVLNATTLVALGMGLALVAIFEVLGIGWTMMAHARSN